MIRYIGSAFLTVTSAISSFKSKHEIKSDTIMGVPVWTVVVGFTAAICWNMKKVSDLGEEQAESKRKMEEIEREYKRSVAELEVKYAEEKRRSNQLFELLIRILEKDDQSLDH